MAFFFWIVRLEYTKYVYLVYSTVSIFLFGEFPCPIRLPLCESRSLAETHALLAPRVKILPACGKWRNRLFSPAATFWLFLWDVFEKGDIVLADRGFCGFADFWILLERGVDCLMRKHQRRTAGQRTVRRLGKGDWLVAWRKTGVCPEWLERGAWRAMPEELLVRQIDFTVAIAGFRTKKISIATTLLDPRLFPKASLVELYRRRWHVELFLRDIKSSLRMDVLKCKSPDRIEKEIAMYWIAYNLIRTLMHQAARNHGESPLRISFKRTADALREWGPLIHSARSDGKAQNRLIEILLAAIARLTLPDRPDRTEPRAIKRRKKNYQLLNKPRKEFREILHRNKYKAPLS
jgi:hypothetical protein